MNPDYINKPQVFACEVRAEWHALHRELSEINLDTALSRADRVQKAFDRLLGFYVRIGNLLLNHNPDNQED